MVLSLTGYGSASFTDDVGRISVELKAVNNRFLQIDTRLPHGYSWADSLIKEVIGSRVSRGKIYANLEIVDYTPNQEMIVNLAMVDKLLKINQSVNNGRGVNLQSSFDGLLALPGVMKLDAKPPDNEYAWQRIKPILEEALESFIAARRREGTNLADELKTHAKAIEAITEKIESAVPEIKKQFAARFTQRIKELAADASYDKTRLETEIAIWVDKSDITEELTRLKSHLKELNTTLSSNEPSGRRLDFLLQEFNREANTLGSKITDIGVTKLVIDIKCEIEKIREQAQNIE